MNKLKVAVIGCGSIAQNRHLIEYHNNEQAEIVAVCDKVESRAKATAIQYNAKAYTSYQQLLAMEDIDAVSVCLPNALHAPVTIAALTKDCHVLCEKPMATSREEAEKMIVTAKDFNKKLMIAHNQRFASSHEKARDLIASGAIGKVTSFRTTFGHGGPEGWSADGSDSWFFRKDEAFIGAMGDLGVHKADLLRYILNEEIVDVAGFIENNVKENSTVDDNAVCILRTESGIIGTLAASWAYVPNEDNSTIIYGEKGTLRMEDDPEHALIASYRDGEVVKYQLGKIQTNDAGGQTSSCVVDHFIDCIIENKEPLINGEEGMRSLEVILAALQSNETKQITTIVK
ncbi:Gfo/Idh/MocA family protein [Pontibacillus litoralis]|uniref:NADH-dependent dehydrogenase n=1 Tax=Pontibacillus litoralis JSM 072002 TaxID=1385512 RepID=A0A0A5G6V1_9BACI|nr:Gfo/Idh/MocA family oxidoreductase [Pontibacillus litoralis]KGX87784.1 NADH-dependent dehydrogenase [Pontibacillus litoralis JSM 072002]